MRIISGIYGGRQLQAPKSLPVRPTTDYAKSGLFSILQHRYNFKKLEVADLFAGTGSLTYEFLSRGCPSVVAVDKHPGCIKFIRETFEKFGMTGGSAITADALKFLKNRISPFDIIIADAPFADTPAEALSAAVTEGRLLKKNGVLIIEHQTKNSLSEVPGFLETRKYGNVSFSFFGMSEEAPNE